MGQWPCTSCPLLWYLPYPFFGWILVRAHATPWDGAFIFDHDSLVLGDRSALLPPPQPREKVIVFICDTLLPPIPWERYSTQLLPILPPPPAPPPPRAPLPPRTSKCDAGSRKGQHGHRTATRRTKRLRGSNRTRTSSTSASCQEVHTSRSISYRPRTLNLEVRETKRFSLLNVVTRAYQRNW